MKYYTTEEIKFLIKYYPLKGPKYCSQKINKSYGSISWKANHLGLKVNHDVRSQIIKDFHKNKPDKSFKDYKVDPEQYISNYLRSNIMINF